MGPIYSGYFLPAVHVLSCHQLENILGRLRTRSDHIFLGLGIWDAGLEHYHAAPWVLLIS